MIENLRKTVLVAYPQLMDDCDDKDAVQIQTYTFHDTWHVLLYSGTYRLVTAETCWGISAAAVTAAEYAAWLNALLFVAGISEPALGLRVRALNVGQT